MPISLFKRYAVTLTIKNRLVGGIPTNQDLIKGWIAANMPAVDEAEREKLALKTASELPQATEDKAEGMWTTFKKDLEGIYLEDRNVKAMFKECANILREKLIKDEKAEKNAKAKAAGDKPEKETKSRYTNLKSKIAERLFIEEGKIRFTKKGKPVLAVDGNEERAIHVMTAQGPRTALKRCDFVEGPVDLSFTIRLLDDGVIDEELISVLLEYGGWNGMGADRSQGNGLFSVTQLKAI